MGCSQATKITCDYAGKYDPETGRVYGRENQMYNFLGEFGYSTALTAYNSMSIGADGTFFSSQGAGLSHVKIYNKRLQGIDSRQGIVTVTVGGWGLGEGGEAGYKFTLKQQELCKHDYFIKKIPGGDTVYTDLGKHYRKILVQGISTTESGAMSGANSVTPSGGVVIKKEVVGNIAKGLYTFTVIYTENCN